MDLVHINKSFQKYLRLLPSPHVSFCAAETDDSASTKSLVSTLVSSNGLGLGLYLAYNILQSLGSLLECSTTDSEACFSFTLPVGVSADSPKPGSAFVKLEDVWADVTSSEAGSRHVVGLRHMVEQMSRDDHSLNVKESITTLKPITPTYAIKASPTAKKLGRVLVVDDSPICRKVLIRALEANDYTTDFACDGQEACNKMSAVPCVYSAVLMDLRMPIMDGITATKLIKDMPHTCRVPIIIVTAEMGESIRAAAAEARADHFLSKPVLVADLLSVLEQYVSK